MIKKTTLLFLLISLTPITAALAHNDKTYDKNGGHYDEWGRYHCHLLNCELTESRGDRRRSFLSSFDRDKFYHEDDWPHWRTTKGSCKSIRTQVLEATSRNPVSYTNPRHCELREGLWVDLYSGEEYTRSAQIVIDHIIPLSYANGTNGYMWDEQTRENFANDPINLAPISHDSQRKKRNRSINSWRPREEFVCEYAQTWQLVSDKYQLDLFGRDASRIRKILEGCGINDN